MIDLIAQVLRHKALKALADIFDPFGKEIVYLFIRHIKERNELLKLLPPDNILLNAFVQYAVTQGLPARWYYINISQGLIVKQVKALIARDILGIPAYYEINNSDDSNVIRALREIIGGNANFPIKP